MICERNFYTNGPMPNPVIPDPVMPDPVILSEAKFLAPYRGDSSLRSEWLRVCSSGRWYHL